MREIREGETGTTILFDVVLGRTCQLTDLKVGNGLTPGYDSHISPKQCEMVIFDNRQCVPVYTFKFKAEKALVEVMEGMNGEFWAK
ncbi:hypothetical protein DFJ73DRAFT_859249 [Zopfochytrium polystomum]|nr:hypothetical protein DFJ73DRAFT_859249 [Zopfochytrium polystomum]